MPITSHQMSSMIGGQQAMFGNFASYSRQISPGFQGQPPTYANPMGGAGGGFAPPPMHMQDPMAMNLGPQAISAAGNIGLPALGTAAMVGGMMLPGAAGRFVGGLDPFMGGLRGFSRGAGLSGGGGILANMGRVASGGVGSILNAGLGGIGGAVAGFMPMYAAGKAAQFGVGQMVQGAQFQNQVQGVLDQNFRFQNNQSASGYGFNRQQGGDIAGMIRTMGHSDMMTGPQELLRVMQSGTQMGLFRAVQDVKEFKKRFTEMVGSLKEVAKTMNTTLEGAMPFFSQARQMGFWTPNDIARNAQSVRNTAATSGLSVAQTQQMMAQGSQMARSIGAAGSTGAQGMQQSLGLVGGGLRSGFLSEQALSEATGGLTGGAAVQAMAGTLQAGATRFARSRKARWVLASLGQNNFSSLDPGKLRDMMSGNMSLGEISRDARRNISQQGAFNFVNNEEQLRGELVKQGPMAELGFTRAMAGKYLYRDDPKSKLVTRRLIKRSFGYNNQQADAYAKLARNSAQIMRDNLSRGESDIDQLERGQYDMINKSWEGMKRRVSNWVDKTVKEPLQEYGSEVSRTIGDYFERVGNKLWGTASAGNRFRGITRSGVDALQRGAWGDSRAMEQTFGKSGSLEKAFGGLGSAGDLGVGGNMDFSGGGGGLFRAWTGKRGGAMNALALTTGLGGEVTTDKMGVLLDMGAQERKFSTAEARDRAVRGGGLYAGRMEGAKMGWTSETAASYNAFEKKEADKLLLGLGAGVSGKIMDDKQARALGYQTKELADKALTSAREEISSTAFRRSVMSMGSLKGKTGMDLAKAQIAEIEAGRLGSDALRRTLGGSKTLGAKISFLGAASVGTRAMRGGVDLREAAEEADIGTFSGLEDLEGQIERGLEAGMTGLGEALASSGRPKDFVAGGGSKGGIMGQWREQDRGGLATDTTPETMLEVEKKGGDEFKKAMRLLATGTGEEADANRMAAQDILTNLASDKDRFSPNEAAILMAMTDKNHPNAAGVRTFTRKLGNLYKVQEQAKFTEATTRRANRFFKSMGEEKGQVLGQLDQIKGKSGKSMGQLIREISESTGDADAYVEKMRELTALASEAPEKQVSQAAALIENYAGGAAYATVLFGGRETPKMMKRLTNKRKPGVAMGALRDVLGDLLGDRNITEDEMKRIQAGDQETIRKISEAAPKEYQDRVGEVLTGVGKGGEELKKVLIGQATGHGMGVLGAGADPKDKLQIIGRMGSSSGIHQTIAEGNRLLQQLIEVTKANGGGTGTGNLKEDYVDYGPPLPKGVKG
jgi:hypothetical protein